MKNITPEKYMQLAKQYNSALEEVKEELNKALGSRNGFNSYRITSLTDKGVVSILKIKRSYYKEYMDVDFVYNYDTEFETYPTTNPYDEGWKTVKGNFYKDKSDTFVSDILIEEDYDIKKDKFKKLLIKEKIKEVQNFKEIAERDLQKRVKELELLESLIK